MKETKITGGVLIKKTKITKTVYMYVMSGIIFLLFFHISYSQVPIEEKRTQRVPSLSDRKGSYTTDNNYIERLKEVKSFLMENDPRVIIKQRYKSPGKNTLLEILRDADPLVRIAALHFLCEGYTFSFPAKCEDYLINALKDEDLAVRYFAVSKLLQSLDAERKPIKSAVLDIKDDKPIMSFMIARLQSYPEITAPTMNKIYNNRDLGLLRLEAFKELYLYCSSTFSDFILGRSHKLIHEALRDADSKIRIAAIDFLLDEISISKDINAQRILKKSRKEDSIIKRYLEYRGYIDSYKERYSKYMTNYRKGIIDSPPDPREATMAVYDAFSDEDSGVRFMFAHYLWSSYSTGILPPEFVPLIYIGLKNDDVWVRFFTSRTLIGHKEYKEHMMEARRVFGQSLEELVKTNDEEIAYLVLSYQAVPLEGCPDKSVLINIFNDKRSLVRYGLLEMLMSSLYNKREARVTYNELYKIERDISQQPAPK